MHEWNFNTVPFVSFFSVFPEALRLAFATAVPGRLLVGFADKAFCSENSILEQPYSPSAYLHAKHRKHRCFRGLLLRGLLKRAVSLK